jgi:hypothetical protein
MARAKQARQLQTAPDGAPALLRRASLSESLADACASPLPISCGGATSTMTNAGNSVSTRRPVVVVACACRRTDTANSASAPSCLSSEG